MTSPDLTALSLTAAASFLVGVLMEPLKLKLSENFTKRKLRRLCYERIYIVRSTASRAMAAFAREPRKEGKDRTCSFGEDYGRVLMKNLDIGIFRYALEKEIGILFQLDVGTPVAEIVHLVDELKEADIAKMREIAAHLTLLIDNAVNHQKLDGGYLTQIAMRERDHLRFADYVQPPDEADKLRFGYRNEWLPEISIVSPFMRRVIWRCQSLLPSFPRKRPGA